MLCICSDRSLMVWRCRKVCICTPDTTLGIWSFLYILKKKHIIFRAFLYVYCFCWQCFIILLWKFNYDCGNLKNHKPFQRLLLVCSAIFKFTRFFTPPKNDFNTYIVFNPGEHHAIVWPSASHRELVADPRITHNHSPTLLSDAHRITTSHRVNFK